jgi:hypothetical protein
MFPPPFNVDPNWYQNYWFGERPPAKRKVFRRSITRFAALVVLVAGGGVLLSQFHP